MAQQEVPIHEVRPTSQELKIPARFIPQPVLEPGHTYSSGDSESESGDQKMNAERRTQNAELRNVLFPSSFFILRSAFCIQI
jgi:hypothetical protein